MSDTLVVYFSRKGYARRVALEMQARTQADVLELHTTEHTQGILGFWWCGRFGMHRWHMPLAPYDIDVSAYRRVIVVSPVWVFTACAPVYAFARQESGRVRSVEYVFVHFSPFMRYPKTVEKLDQMLGIKNEGYQSVACAWGLRYLRRRYATLTKS